MTDGVKFIFKTLLKVPFVIFIAYIFLNLFGFCFIYFKVLGVSYVVMQTAVENNYLPSSERKVLSDYVDDLNNIHFVENACLVVGQRDDGTYVKYNASNAALSSSDATNAGYALNKVQYGREVTVGVACDFIMQWPLQTKEQTQGNTGVVGMGSGTTTFKSTAQLEAAREANTSRNDITITFTVPGLKYYPDLRLH